MGFYSKRLKFSAWLIFYMDLLILVDVFLYGISTPFIKYYELSCEFLRGYGAIDEETPEFLSDGGPVGGRVGF